MNRTNRIKLLIIVAVLLGELAVFTFPREQATTQSPLPQAPESQASLENTNQETSEKAEPEPKQVQEQEPVQEQVQSQDLISKEAVDNGLMILVNKEYYLDKNYKPGDLEPIEYYTQNRSAESRFMRAEAAEQFNRMALAGKEAGYEIVMTTAYRSYGFQSVLYNNYVAKYGQSEADKFSAKPGYSEHQTGLAVDVSSPSVGYALTAAFDETPEWKWLSENAESFGFILRYPEGKTEITGYMYEPWHFRYVGLDAAKVIQEENITLEEYIDQYLNI